MIIGSGPAGLFAATCSHKRLSSDSAGTRKGRGSAQKGCRSLLERRTLKPGIQRFVGEGGAGTFSDGKLNTLIKDKDGRGRHVLSIFVENGAQPEILYEAKPHIGTDVLSNVVKQMREKIIQLGGEVRFESRVRNLPYGNGALTGVILRMAL